VMFNGMKSIGSVAASIAAHPIDAATFMPKLAIGLWNKGSGGMLKIPGQEEAEAMVDEVFHIPTAEELFANPLGPAMTVGIIGGAVEGAAALRAPKVSTAVRSAEKVMSDTLNTSKKAEPQLHPAFAEDARPYPSGGMNFLDKTKTENELYSALESEISNLTLAQLKGATAGKTKMELRAEAFGKVQAERSAPSEVVSEASKYFTDDSVISESMLSQIFSEMDPLAETKAPKAKIPGLPEVRISSEPSVWRNIYEAARDLIDEGVSKVKQSLEPKVKMDMSQGTVWVEDAMGIGRWESIAERKANRAATEAERYRRSILLEEEGYEEGGHIPGFGGGDTVPALLEPGEFVMRKEAVTRYGLDQFAKLNKMGVQKFATGGPVASAMVPQTNSKDFTPNIALLNKSILELTKSINALNSKSTAKTAGTGKSAFVEQTATAAKEATTVGVSSALDAFLPLVTSINAAGEEFKSILVELSPGKWGYQPVTETKKYAFGGFLGGGYGGGDRIPIMGESGEFMLRKESVKKYGIDFISSLNSMKVTPSVPLPTSLSTASVDTAPQVQMLAAGGPVGGGMQVDGSSVYNLNLMVEGKSYETFATRAVIDAVMREIPNKLGKERATKR